MESSYLDVKDIIASNVKVGALLNVELADKDLVSANTSFRLQEENQQGTKIQVPLWLPLSLQDKRGVGIRPSEELPPSYGKMSKTILRADAPVVDLHKKGPFFYRSGMQLAKLYPDQVDNIKETLKKTFKSRLVWLFDKSTCSYKCEAPQNLDKDEQVLFAYGQEILEEYMKWQSLECEKITPSPMILLHGRRNTGRRSE